MKDLLLAWLSPGVSGGVTCRHCGLEYPHRNYRVVLAACPGCGSREWDWSHLVRDYDRSWKRLDGYAGAKHQNGSKSGCSTTGAISSRLGANPAGLGVR
jgi:hypothetical protein